MRRVLASAVLAFLLILAGGFLSASARAPQDQRIPDLGSSTQTYVEAWKAYREGDYDRALALANRGLEADRLSGARKGVAEALNLIGTVHYKRGDYAGALPFYLQAAQVAEEAGYSFGLARDWSSLGSTAYRTGDYQRAKEYYEKSLQLRRELGDQDEVARALNDLANVFQQLGDFPRAIGLRLEALRLWKQSGNPAGIADALNDLGGTCEEMGRHGDALAYLRQSLAASRKIRDLPGIYDDLENIGLIESKLGRHDEALRNLTAAYRGFQSLGQLDDVASTLNELGAAYYRRSNYRSARHRFEEALRIELAIGNHPVEGVTLSGLMRCWRELHSTRLAVFYGKQAVNLYQQFREEMRRLDPALQKSFVRRQAATYRELAAVLVATGRLPEAQEVLDLLKEEEYFDFVRRSGPQSDPTIASAALTPAEAELETRYREAAGEVTAAGLERSKLVEKKSRTAEEERRLAELTARLDQANQDFQKFLDGLYAESRQPSAAQERLSQLEERASGLQAILREMDPGTVALYTLVGEDKYRVIVITADVMHAHAYPLSAADLRAKVFRFRRAIQDPEEPAEVVVPLARELYRILLAPAQKDLDGARASTLLWSLDDVLRYLPLAALHDGRGYLVEKYRNAIITPASEGRLKDRPEVQDWRGLGLGVSKASGKLPALPTVPAELRSVIRDPGAPQGQGVVPGIVLLDEAFTETNMKRALQQHYPLVHIASHFVFQPGNDLNSYLLLGDKDPAAGGDHLTLAEIRRSVDISFFGTELLALSACNTATGGGAEEDSSGQANGREVDGLGMMAQRKGAKAVLASLWEVSDESTGLLMRAFYLHWVMHTDVSKAEALRQAQLALLSGQLQGRGQGRPVSFAHPYFWAPFVLIGNPR